MNWLLENWEIVLAAAVAAATAITRLTPTPKDDEALSKVKALLSRLSLLHHKDSGRHWKSPGPQAPTQPRHPDD